MPTGTVETTKTTGTAATTTADGPRRQARYLHRPVADIALAFAWVPFVLGARVLEQRGEISTLGLFISGVFLLSFAHQPLTIALVYGDPAQFRLRRAIFTWSPIVFVVAIVAGYSIGFVLVAVVGALWNAEHTLMQRYGVTRIYGRMAGQDDGVLEKVMLFSWLIAATLWVTADASTPDRARVLPLGQNNQVAIDVLGQLRPYALALLVPTAIVAVVVAVLWVRGESRRPGLNPMKWVYLASTLVLFGIIMVDPVAGIMGYVGAHAVEYFVIVYQSMGKRYASAELDQGAPLGRAVRARPGRLGFMAGYVAVVIGIVTALERLGNPMAYAIVFFTLGGLHVFYDGFIWKLRRPVVARSLSIPDAA